MSARSVPGARNLVVDAATGRATAWQDLPTVELPAPAAVLVPRSIDAFPAVSAHADTGAELLVVSASRLEAGLRDELLAGGFNLLSDGEIEAATVPREPEPERVWLLTSGSTGRPKRIGHTLGSLTTVSQGQAPRRWLCPYSPGTYAWWQVVTLGLGSERQDLVVVDPADLLQWPAAAKEHGVTAASGTPTFWRQSLLRDAEAVAAVPLEQITLGGEPVDQAILDQLRATFPKARISWIYASSEVGASIVVHDGRAGFPVEWLDRTVPGRPRVSVDRDELVVVSPHHGAGLEGAVPTGDRVVVEDGRVLIVGRVDSDEINVGGSKVSAGMVRSVLQTHPRITWAKVSGRKAPIVGTVVQAEVVLTNGEGDEATIIELSDWARERLPEHGVPRRFRFLAEIPSKETLKSDV